MQDTLIIVGAGGHGKVVADIAENVGYHNIVFVDPNSEKKSCGRYPVVGTNDMINDLQGDIIVAIGNALMRKKTLESLSGRRIPTLIHPDAVVADDVVIGKGTVVMAGAVINSGTQIGKGCIINTCASVDHDCVIEDYVHVSIGVHIAGTVTIQENTWIGAGAVVSNNITIQQDCMIGAGAVVIKNIERAGTYVGVPAAQIK